METRKKKLVISTGAGISAESGMATYRDAGGLWDNYPVMQVASADGFEQDPALIHRFYSNLRKKLRTAGGRDYIESVWGIGFTLKTS